MALKILLADPDDKWLAAAKKYFQDQSYEVKTVANGKDAQLAVYNDTFFCAILNHQLKNHPAIQVLKFIQSNNPGMKVIWILPENAGPDEEIDEERLRKMGVLDFIKKPFEFNDLKAVLEGHQNINDLVSGLPKKQGLSKEEEVTLSDADFTNIKISEFLSGKAVLFDVFIKLKSDRYIKILHAGDTFSKERIEKYKNEKKVEFLYFQNKDRQKFIKYNSHILKKTLTNKKVHTQVKVAMMKNVSKKFMEEAFSEGLKPQLVDQCKEICENVYNMVQGEKDLYAVLKDYQDFDPGAFDHAFLTTLFATSIIKQFEWQSKVAIESAAMACMFHDIGKMKLPKEILDLRPDKMDAKQLELYKKHPELGVELIEGSRLVNNSVKQIVIQHHEYYDGTGFPSGKKRAKVATMANIVCLASDFTRLLIEKDIKPVQGLKLLLSDSKAVGRYNSMIIEKFIQVFVDPSKIAKEKSNISMNTHVVPNKKVS